jgi:hypothetical protein
MQLAHAADPRMSFFLGPHSTTVICTTHSTGGSLLPRCAHKGRGVRRVGWRSPMARAAKGSATMLAAAAVRRPGSAVNYTIWRQGHAHRE